MTVIEGSRAPEATPRTPVWLWIDPTRRCNLSCALCYTKVSHSDSDLSPEVLSTIYERLTATDRIVYPIIHLNWRGEPLLNKRFEELLVLTGEHLPKVKLQWHTNGTTLTERRAGRIVDTGVKQKIYVSVDGGTQETHDANRGSGTFERTLRGLERLLDRAEGNDHVTVAVYQIDMGLAPEAFDPRFRRLLKRVAEHIRVLPLLSGGVENRLNDISALASDEALDRMIAQEMNPHQPQPQAPCFWAGYAFCIQPDGDVAVCLLSHGEKGILGNLLREPVDAVLARAQAFRAEILAKGRGQIAHCARCRKLAAQPIWSEPVAGSVEPID